LLNIGRGDFGTCKSGNPPLFLGVFTDGTECVDGILSAVNPSGKTFPVHFSAAKYCAQHSFYSGIPNLVCTGKSVVGDAGGGSTGAGAEYVLGERKGCTEEKLMSKTILGCKIQE